MRLVGRYDNDGIDGIVAVNAGHRCAQPSLRAALDDDARNSSGVAQRGLLCGRLRPHFVSSTNTARYLGDGKFVVCGR